jgi:hypothetical protein
MAIWTRFETYRSGHHQGIGYALPGSNHFQDWNVAQRYAQRSDFAQARVQPHRAGAWTVRELIKKAQYEGLI